MTEKVNEDEVEYNFLVTRAKFHQRKLDEEEISITKQRKTNYLAKFISCGNHKTVDKACSECLSFPVQENLPNGRLPTRKQVLGYVFHLNTVENNNMNIQNAVADIMNQWISCNVYTTTQRMVRQKLQKLVDTYNNMKKTPQKKKGPTFSINLKNFSKLCEGLFDVKCTDKSRQSMQESIWKVKETDVERQFYQGQCKIPQEGYCTAKVDPGWLKTTRRNEKIEEGFEKRRKEAESSNFENQVEFNILDILDIVDETENDDDDEDYAPEEKKGRFSFMPSGKRNHDIPDEYCHVRGGLRSVRECIYLVMNKLSSELHMSKHQIEQSLIIIVYHLFGLDWKPYKKHDTPDFDTLPCMDNLRKTEPFFEAMALNAIVKEMMKDDSNSSITYSNDGSSRSGVGSYVVQSLTINGVQRSLPSFGVFTESRETLRDLEIATLKILSAASFHEYSEQDILRKISFVMSDSTSHNLQVIESVCEELEVEEIPGTLLCNVHPLMMLQGKIKELCQEIHDSLGKKKISECFLVDVEFQNESFVVKSLKCLSNFINKDYSAKPWNRYSHFSSFIKPKENHSLSLKDHRFNRLNDCAVAILYHMDDIANYLEQFSNIINGITILDRSFLEMEVLKPIYAAISIVGIHILKPFHQLILDNDTKYSTLLTSFPKLYDELVSIPPCDMLTVNQVFHFANSDHFKDALPNADLSKNVMEVANAYSHEVTQLLSLLLKKFAQGFEYQKGAIFGFGGKKDDGTGTVLKICNLSKEKLMQLDKVQIHNLGEERGVGFLNYELDIRGKQNLEAASRKMVLNKSADLISRSADNFKKFRKPAAEIKEIKLIWNKKMKEMEEKGFTQKDIVNTSLERQKLDDLEFLGKQSIPGPFTSSDSVTNFMEIEPESKAKNQRLYIEVRFQRNTTQSLKKEAAIFRLKRGGKSLDTAEYATHLCQYLDQSRSVTNLTMSDLRNVLTGLNGIAGHNTETEIVSENLTSTTSKETSQFASDEMASNSFQCGEHLACVWYDDKDNCLKWYLGVVDGVAEDSVLVSYMQKSDKKGTKWLFPDEAEIHKTNPDQILLRHIQVSYTLTAMIRCELSKATLEKIVNLFDKYNR